MKISNLLAMFVVVCLGHFIIQCSESSSSFQMNVNSYKQFNAINTPKIWHTFQKRQAEGKWQNSFDPMNLLNQFNQASADKNHNKMALAILHITFIIFSDKKLGNILKTSTMLSEIDKVAARNDIPASEVKLLKKESAEKVERAQWNKIIRDTEDRIKKNKAKKKRK